MRRHYEDTASEITEKYTGELNFSDEPSVGHGVKPRNKHHTYTEANKGFKITQAELEASPGYAVPIAKRKRISLWVK